MSDIELIGCAYASKRPDLSSKKQNAIELTEYSYLVPSGTSKMYDDCTAYKVTSNVQPGSDGRGIIGLQGISPFVLGCIHCKMSYFCLSNDQCVVLMPGFSICVIQGHIFQVTEKVIATESLVDSPAKVQVKEAVATPNPLPLVRYFILLCENDGAHHM